VSSEEFVERVPLHVFPCLFVFLLLIPESFLQNWIPPSVVVYTGGS